MSDGLNIEEINNELANNFIHIDLDVTNYSVSEAELELINNGGNSIWKDFMLLGFGVGVPCWLNSYHEYQRLSDIAQAAELPIQYNLELFLNCLIGSVCIIIAVICLVVWRRTTSTFTELINKIKNKPKYKIPEPKKTTS